MNFEKMNDAIKHIVTFCTIAGHKAFTGLGSYEILLIKYSKIKE